MVKLTSRARFWVVVVMILMGVASSSEVFARGEGHGDHHGREVVSSGHKRYYYDSGRFYHWSLFGYVNIAPPVGVEVSFLPDDCSTIVVGDSRYFCYNNVYYAPQRSGYVVVPQPSLNRETVLINVPNRNGSFTPITLLKTENGYVGPQGEYYTGNPTVEQLRALYGR